jgi:hypothetical protein
MRRMQSLAHLSSHRIAIAGLIIGYLFLAVFAAFAALLLAANSSGPPIVRQLY